MGFVLIALSTWVFWRYLVVFTFDETFAALSGVPVWLISAGLAVAATVAAIVAFDAVGSIIVVSMFVCPPAAARVLTNVLRNQVVLSLLFAALSAVFGYAIAGYVPILLGFETSISAAGTIATLSGVILASAILFGKNNRT
jgi:manganese/zinc/iron transport system permease protein